MTPIFYLSCLSTYCVKKAETEKIIEENDTSKMDNTTMFNITNANAEMHEKEISFLTIYGLFGVGQTIAVVFASLLLYLSTLTGAKTLHSKMLSNILRNPLSFFDTTPQVRAHTAHCKTLLYRALYKYAAGGGKLRSSLAKKEQVFLLGSRWEACRTLL